jgi:hypothetical protein
MSNMLTGKLMEQRVVVLPSLSQIRTSVLYLCGLPKLGVRQIEAVFDLNYQSTVQTRGFAVLPLSGLEFHSKLFGQSAMCLQPSSFHSL